jgi:hypothetical protein
MRGSKAEIVNPKKEKEKEKKPTSSLNRLFSSREKEPA